MKDLFYLASIIWGISRSEAAERRIEALENPGVT